MQPFKDLLVVEQLPEPKEKQEGGLWFQPPRWAKPQSIVKVLEVGPLVTIAKKGDVILINPYAVIDTNDKLIKIVREDDALCQLSQDR